MAKYHRKYFFGNCKQCEKKLVGSQQKFCSLDCCSKWWKINSKKKGPRKKHEFKNSGLLKCVQCSTTLKGGKRKYCNKQCMNKWKWANDPLTKKRYILSRETREYKRKIKTPYKKKVGIDRFKASCRCYAATKIKKISCQYCGTDKDLQRHHTEGYHLRSIKGVIVLCSKCHNREHRKI